MSPIPGTLLSCTVVADRANRRSEGLTVFEFDFGFGAPGLDRGHDEAGNCYRRWCSPESSPLERP